MMGSPSAGIPTAAIDRTMRPRSAALKRGAAAEEAVADYLATKGFVIVGQNIHVGRLELDIVARVDDLIVVVEVRHRGTTSWQTALGSLGPSKLQRIRSAGERLWDQRFAADPRANRMRFDIATVSFNPKGETIVEYLPGAF